MNLCRKGGRFTSCATPGAVSVFDPCLPAGVPSGAFNPVPPPPPAPPPAQRPPRASTRDSRRPAPAASPPVYIAVVGPPETRYWQVMAQGSPITPELRRAVGPLEIVAGVVRPADTSSATYRTEDQLVRAAATRFASAAGNAEWDNRRDQAPVFHNGRWRILGALLLDTQPGERLGLGSDEGLMLRLTPLLPTDPRIPMPEPVRLAATADLATEAGDQATAWGRYKQRLLLELGDRRFDPAYAPLLAAVDEIRQAFEAVAEARRRRPRQIPRTAIAHALRLQLNPPPQQLLLTIPLGRMLERIRAWKRENEP